MIMSRQASRLVGDVGTVVPDASRHRLFTAEPVDVEGTAR
jgi:hypothetical protein